MHLPTLSSLDPDLRASWRSIVAHYQTPDMHHSLWMLVNSVLPFCVLWGLMAWTVHISYWLTLLLAIPTAGFMMRIFIIFHDCGHGSYFKSQHWNVWVGRVTGVLTLTPFYHWTRDHAIHHATAGDLDRRGVGDVTTLTVAEYQALPLLFRMGYRLMRSAWFLFPIGAPFVFLIGHRIPRRRGLGPKETRSIWTTNLAILILFAGLSWLVGWKTVLMVHLPIMWFGSMAGVWLFYVQHQYESVYWRRHSEWDYLASAIEGASYYRLPRLLQWFSGNIGFHHLHHLAPRIPNYMLEKCHSENPVFHSVQPITLLSSLRCVNMNLYDEVLRRMVSFSDLKRITPVRAD